MVTINEAKHIRLVNVNTGLLKRDNEGYFVDIPVYPLQRTQSNILKLFKLNAPIEFMNCLTNDVTSKDVVFYSFRITEDIEINKEDFKTEFEDFGYANQYPEILTFIESNTIEDIIKHITSLNDENLPFLTYKKTFENDF